MKSREILLKLEESQEKVRMFVRLCRWFLWCPIDNSTQCIHMPKPRSRLLFAYRVQINFSIDINDIPRFKRWVGRTICKTDWSGKYYVFLICNIPTYMLKAFLSSSLKATIIGTTCSYVASASEGNFCL